MTAQRIHFGLLLVMAALAFALVRRSLSDAPPPPGPAARARPDAVELLLPEASLLLTLDVRAMGRSAAGRALLARLVDLAGSKTAGSCADRQLTRVRRLGLAVPATSTGLELGVVAEGDFDAVEVLACAEELLKNRGGDPVHSHVAGFRVLRDRRGSGELAVVDGGPLILSGNTYFRDLLDRASGALPREHGTRERLHLALRARAGDAPLLGTAVLPPGWLQHWLGEPDVARSPLALVRAVVVRGELDGALRLHVELSAEDAAGAVRIEAFLRTAAADFLGLSEQAAALAVQREAERVRVTLDERALALLDRLGAPSHALDRPDAQEVEPDAERAPRGRTQDQP